MKRPNRAGQALGKQLEKHGERVKLANEMGVSPTLVTRWANQETLPEAKSQLWLAEHRGIQMVWWQEPPLPEHVESAPPPSRVGT